MLGIDAALFFRMSLKGCAFAIETFGSFRLFLCGIHLCTISFSCCLMRKLTSTLRLQPLLYAFHPLGSSFRALSIPRAVAVSISHPHAISSIRYRLS